MAAGQFRRNKLVLKRTAARSVVSFEGVGAKTGGPGKIYGRHLIMVGRFIRDILSIFFILISSAALRKALQIAFINNAIDYLLGLRYPFNISRFL